jgi:hypothetical protein
MYRIIAFTIGMLIVGSVSAQADAPYGPFNFDGGSITCKSTSGDEIKKWQSYKADEGRYFKEGSISVRKISGSAPKENKCELSDIRRENIKVTTDSGQTEVSVIKEFTVFAGAECGTNITMFTGKTASIVCEVSATQVKYSNK